ncbi:Lrp/AsnC ligand binding domain-containing protein [Kordia jejudonensis]|uniref:Lrp/AsnC ligand binding domain-containing protein n=1 Tax=Kordia jejudonensis TaxID=1348245 RepID=UPI00138E3ED9
MIILINIFHGKLTRFFDVIPQIPEIERAYPITGEQNVHLKLILSDITEYHI